MIKKFNLLAMIMFMAVLPIAFASCSDNEEGDEPKLPQPEVEGLLVTYSAQIDSAMLDYLDVTVEYTDHDGQTATAKLDGKQWTQSVAFVREKGELPTDLGVELKIAKKQSPEFGNSVHIEGQVAWEVYTIFSDGTSIKNAIGSGSPYESRTFAVDKLDEYIVRKNGVIAYQWAHGIKYDENGKVVSLQ